MGAVIDTLKISCPSTSFLIFFSFNEPFRVDVKHQVFVSSTFKDLIDERKAVIHALLELDCIPAGMELFPATDEDAWTLIKEVIDDCDYYILIIAGKYGSTNAEGVSYTEMEFDYASSVGKPIIAFLHTDIGELASNLVEKSEAGQKKLADFRKRAETKHCKHWVNAEDLGGKVSRSLIQLRKRHPSPGWVPGRFAATAELLAELEALRALSLQVHPPGPPPGSENLAQGGDTLSLTIGIHIDDKKKHGERVVSVSWDTLFKYCGSMLSNECTDEELLQRCQLACYHALNEELLEFNFATDVTIPWVIEDKVRIQFQALGLMAPGVKKRAVADKSRYWRLTPYGHQYLVSISAVRKENYFP